MKLWALLLAVVLLATGSVLSAGAAPRDGGDALPDSVYVGGMPFGVKFYTEGILVVGFCDVDTADGTTGNGHVNPARDAGIHMKDVIVGVNGEYTDCRTQRGCEHRQRRFQATGLHQGAGHFCRRF